MRCSLVRLLLSVWRQRGGLLRSRVFFFLLFALLCVMAQLRAHCVGACSGRRAEHDALVISAFSLFLLFGARADMFFFSCCHLLGSSAVGRRNVWRSGRDVTTCFFHSFFMFLFFAPVLVVEQARCAHVLAAGSSSFDIPPPPFFFWRFSGSVHRAFVRMAVVLTCILLE